MTPSAATISAGHLRDMIESVLWAAGKDNTLPTLTSIFFEMDPREGTLILTTTDRYKLINATVPAVLSFDTSDEEIRSFILQRADAAALVKMLPKPTKNRPDSPCRIDFEEKKNIFTWEGGMATFENYPAEFPKYRSLIEGRNKKPEPPAAVISFNSDYLAILAKVKTARVWDFNFSGPGKPVYCYSQPDMASDPKYLVMIMPVRRVK